ncbi:YafY family protein [Variovorax sp. dw_308]|uniref:helix-turn-helix transcriptional regulator n=1 Tax=Variovorax sp. dw_308 TaxID=2721546 RepID=UPI001C46DD92|nr:WYL domain-containing protein [Variovorax sp. dw_308]
MKSETTKQLTTLSPDFRFGANWSQDRRLEFIDFRLRWEGKLNRADLTDFFGISVQQASLDLARYMELAPSNLAYDRSQKIYLAADKFAQLFPSSDTSRFLFELLVREFVKDSMLGFSFVGWTPPMEAVPNPGRNFDATVLAAVVRSIRDQTSLRVTYQSMSTPKPSNRTLSPHALAHDGFRWHTRAWCHERKEFRDFTIARFLQAVEVSDVPQIGREGPDKDVAWNTIVKLVLGPHPELPAAKRRVIELDYGMKEGKVEFVCRQAFLFYALRHLRLESESTATPEAQQVVLLNRKQLTKQGLLSSPK